MKTTLPDAFVICTTERMAATTSDTSGKYCVQINPPGKFFDLVAARLSVKRSTVAGTRVGERQ
jgi:hypothetical protein